ncbi:uncharacterized protein FYW49_011461 isoform 11-T11 [Xenentodon cancila]
MNLWRKLNLTESLQDQLNIDVEVRLRSTETHLEHLETLTAALEVKLGVKEEQLEDLRTQNSDQTSTLMNLWRKLNLSESLQDKLNTADVEFKLRSTETHLEQLENFTAALEVKLGVKEEQLEDLRTQNSDQTSTLMNLWRKLNLSESLQDKLNTADVEFKLRSTETHLEQLENFTAALEVKLGVKEEQLEDLRTQNSDQTSTLMNLWRKLNLSESLQDKLNTADVEFKLRSTETHLEQLENFTAALEVKLGVKEEQLEDLRTQNSDQTSTLMNLWRKLNLSESLQDKLNTDVEVRLRSTETHLEHLETLTAALEVKLGVKEEQLEDLRTQNSDQTSTLMNLWRKLNLSESLQDKLNTDVEFKLRSTETHLEQLENFTAALEVKLGVKEEQLEDLRTQNSDQTSTLMNLWRKLNLSESLQDKLNTADVEFKLRSTETHLEQLENFTAALKVKLRVNEDQLEDLKIQNSDQLSLMGYRLKDGLNKTTVQLSLMDFRLRDGLNRTAADVELRLKSTETHLEQLETFTAGLKVKLGVNEEQLQDLKTQNSGCEARLSAVAVGLNRTEEQLDDLRTQSSGSSALLVSLSDRLTAAQRDTEELQVRLKTSEATVNQLKSKNGDELKVGFSAGLTNSGSIGPFDEETTLIFSKAITNIGQGYNQSAGVFTAPVRGVYFFSFTAADYVKGYMGVNLYRNNQPIIFSLDLNDHGGYASASSTVALQLEEGDQVRLSLPASYRLYDDSRNFSVFSGFLLFQL